MADTDAREAVAVDYLRLFALVSLGWMWSRIVGAAERSGAGHTAKVDVANFFAERVLVQAPSLASAIKAGSKSVMSLPSDAY